MAEGSQVIVTEVFSVAQVIETCERWLRITDETGVRPPFFMSPITGILGDHFKKLARARWAGRARPQAMEMAGVIVSRACYEVVREREYPVTLLYGGARIELDFSGLVGGSMAATINWSTAAELIEHDLPARVSVDRPGRPRRSPRSSTEAFPEMRQALDPDGARASRTSRSSARCSTSATLFIDGWNGVRAMIRRRALELTGRDDGHRVAV